MLYPIYVHKEPESAYGVIFPDFPGCFSAADEAHEIAPMAQEAVEAYFACDDAPIPPPSAPDKWMAHPDYQRGFWMMVEIDLSKVKAKAVRLNISLPENLVQRIDAAAKARHLSRSAFLAMAATREMADH